MSGTYLEGEIWKVSKSEIRSRETETDLGHGVEGPRGLHSIAYSFSKGDKTIGGVLSARQCCVQKRSVNRRNVERVEGFTESAEHIDAGCCGTLNTVAPRAVSQSDVSGGRSMQSQ